MKIELELTDIEAIAKKVTEVIKPLIPRTGVFQQDSVMSVQDLCQYLKVDESWVYKQVSLKKIPFFKAGKYTRFKKSRIDRWIDENDVKPLSKPSLRVMKKG